MVEFFCKSCAARTAETESLTLGKIGIHECVVCGRKIDCQKEKYYIFREGAKERFKIIQRGCGPDQQQGEINENR